MYTTLFLVRNGATDWTRDRRVAGRREVSLSAEGRKQVDALAVRLGGIEIAEIMSSPLPRAVETAERLAAIPKLEVVRDPRLTDIDAGPFEGKPYAEVAQAPEYRLFLDDPSATTFANGERIADVRDRVVASLNQAIADNELGSCIVVVSHAGPLRLALAHYLGMRLSEYHRLHLAPSSLAVLRFESEASMPRVLAVNWPDAIDSIIG